ncbi:MAG: metallophosphoesterase, partial [Enterococcus sp.]
MDQVFVIGDVHGEYELFQEILQKFEPAKQQLILIGDLNDRGPKSKECWLLGMELVEKYQAVYLRGNHEEYFL